MKQIGYKAFDKHLKCRDFQYEIGKTYKIKDKLKICSNGFHFCKRPEDIFNYYSKDKETRVCEIIADGTFQAEGDKIASSEITIIRELSREEVEKICNYNSDYSNSGNSNSGYSNSGHYNSGHYNSGYSNSGDYNSGYSNSGYSNSGYSNSGSSNSGYYNSGHYNSGSSNSGDYNSGYFNTNTPKVRLFNKDTNLDFDSEQIQKMRKLVISKAKPILTWIPSSNMSQEEKQNNPSHVTTGGFLRNNGKTDYSALNNKEDIEFFKSLPNFDADIFFEITGIDVRKPKDIEVIVNGVKKLIPFEKAK